MELIIGNITQEEFETIKKAVQDNQKVWPFRPEFHFDNSTMYCTKLSKRESNTLQTWVHGFYIGKFK